MVLRCGFSEILYALPPPTEKAFRERTLRRILVEPVHFPDKCSRRDCKLTHNTASPDQCRAECVTSCFWLLHRSHLVFAVVALQCSEMELSSPLFGCASPFQLLSPFRLLQPVSVTRRTKVVRDTRTVNKMTLMRLVLKLFCPSAFIFRTVSRWNSVLEVP